MKLNYYPETDSLYIDLSEKSSVESREISEGVQLDYDASGSLVGIDIDNASSKVQLKELNIGLHCTNRKKAAAFLCLDLRVAGLKAPPSRKPSTISVTQFANICQSSRSNSKAKNSAK